jgi:hypothetical protein
MFINAPAVQQSGKVLVNIVVNVTNWVYQGGAIVANGAKQLTNAGDNSQAQQKTSKYFTRERGLPPTGVVPPVANPENLKEGPASRPSEQQKGGKSQYDETGGEWRYFAGDKRHNPHWDYNPNQGGGMMSDGLRANQWRNVPINGLPPRLIDGQ